MTRRLTLPLIVSLLVIGGWCLPVSAQIRAGLINLTSMVTGILPVANGGTGSTSIGSDTQVLFNDGGIVGSDARLKFDAATGVLGFGTGIDVTDPVGLGVFQVLPAATQVDDGYALGALLRLQFTLPDTNTNVPEIDGYVNQVLATIGADLDYYQARNTYSILSLQNNPTINTAISHYNYLAFSGGGTIGVSYNDSIYFSANGAFSSLDAGTHYGTWYQTPVIVNGATVTTVVQMYAAAVGGSAANAYPFWSDEQGVFRIKADNTFNGVYQAIPALYNPQFTKYTAGAANYERWVTQWASNVLQMGAEAGGTGTLRAVQIIGASLVTPATLTVGSNAVSLGGAFTTSGGALTLTSSGGVTLAIGSGGTLGTAAYTAASAYEVPLTFSTGLTRTTNTVTVNTTQNIAKLSNLTSNGFVKTGGGDGTLSVDTAAYCALTGCTMTGTVTSTIGTITSSAPALSATQTWNSSGVTFTGTLLNVTNTASADASLLADWQLAGTSRFSLGRGAWTATSGTVVAATLAPTLNPSSTSTMVGIGLKIAPTINYSAGTPGAGNWEALKIAATETANPSGTNYLIRASAGAAGTTDKFTVSNAGAVVVAAGSAAVSGFYVGGTTENGIYSPSTTQMYLYGGNSAVAQVRSEGLSIDSSKVLGFASLGSTATTTLAADGSDILALKRSTNAQTFRVYGNTTGSKYLILKHDGTNPIIGSSSGALKMDSTAVTPASSGTRYVCIDTAGVISSSASACSGT